MKRYVNNTKGLSLVELLAAITISSLILASIYGVFFSGLNAYKRIHIENQLRSEADYIVATIMNKLYAFAPDGIAMDQTTNAQIAFVSDKEIQFVSDESINPSNPSLVMIKKEKKPTPETLTVVLQDGSIAVDGEQLHSDRLKIVAEESEFSYTCSQQEEEKICRSGVVTIKLAVQDRDHDDPDDLLYIKPFTLKTEFGF
ncbi:prepilin-type N-terminal cleavage/methylation domain-containing protein [Parageobacillus toebii NBRC 107807]|uniref:Prepilin-type N-terminal cleavage/methylation domain-containing protein n=1 Tax=Parageobacillus toebii NBRC 107807 TaxID=1223503 RepID=A0A6G9J0E8_9BACL|nr:prepilin-type N-terminal cleavage/methylation domain-containing protein [Parageobacillus toebii]MBB3867619.1 prepilin-type N-terminal cleavage/methylation domain-containing protein [Parageobacillus toebii NBRC 107807]MED4969509.1 prepilin-type N-terminal cleavage/methylation domain-containing protein [Parageobacillus toebii]QIQ31584.1 prepilin-type N-terminal cleavage/methylation domain-containing protein [Parageobacillus toebii NBRC 107807]QSB49897.1 prepilin-type N-terminal cleavage/methyl